MKREQIAEEERFEGEMTVKGDKLGRLFKEGIRINGQNKYLKIEFRKKKLLKV